MLHEKSIATRSTYESCGSSFVLEIENVIVCSLLLPSAILRVALSMVTSQHANVSLLAVSRHVAVQLLLMKLSVWRLNIRRLSPSQRKEG